jgi:hypothetical protein
VIEKPEDNPRQLSGWQRNSKGVQYSVEVRIWFAEREPLATSMTAMSLVVGTAKCTATNAGRSYWSPQDAFFRQQRGGGTNDARPTFDMRRGCGVSADTGDSCAGRRLWKLPKRLLSGAPSMRNAMRTDVPHRTGPAMDD